MQIDPMKVVRVSSKALSVVAERMCSAHFASWPVMPYWGLQHNGPRLGEVDIPFFQEPRSIGRT